MTGSNRWLLGIGIALALLVAIALIAAAATRGRAPAQYAADTPEGVVQRYLAALLEEDIRAAYGYLTPELQSRCALEVWEDQSRWAHDQIEKSEVVLREVRRPREGQAIVEVTITNFDNHGPSVLPPPVPATHGGFAQHFVLERQGDGNWRLSEPAWPAYCPEPLRPAPFIPPPPTPTATLVPATPMPR